MTNPMDQEIHSDILRRLRCIEGHVRGVARMVEEDEDIYAIIRQVMAVRGALDKVSQILVRDHLSNCLPDGLLDKDRANLEKALTEVGELLLDVRIR